jgi:dTDP-4-dehydrorhamnose reductase
MKTLVFGKDGQLGKAFYQEFIAMPEVSFLGRREYDLSNIKSLVNFLHLSNPDLIINAAAYTDVDKAEENHNDAFAINALAPKAMAYYCAQNDKIFFHFSTDYVFDGQKTMPYHEEDVCEPINVYGKSKLAGELGIQEVFSSKSNQSLGAFYIVRASWIYGDGRNFIRTILRLAKERSELKIVVDQVGVPTNTAWLAKVALLMLGSNKLESGIYHVAPAGKTSRYELALYVLTCAIELKIPLALNIKNIIPVSTQKYSLSAERPINSMLSTEKITKKLPTIHFLLKDEWKIQVKQYIEYLHHHRLI